MDGKSNSTDLPNSLNQANLEIKAMDLDYPEDQNDRVYFLDNTADVTELAKLQQNNGGKADYTKWRSWNLAQEMENRQKDKLIEQMAARLQEIEEKLQQIQKPVAE